MAFPVPRSARPAATGDVPGVPSIWDQLGTGLHNNSNALIGLGSGLLSGDTFAEGLARGGDMWRGGAEKDDAYATQQKEETERQKQLADQIALKDKYAQWFTEQGQPQIAQGIADGIVEPGKAYWDFVSPKAPDQTSDMQNYRFYANEEMKAGRAPVSFMDFSNPSKPAPLPSSYQEYQLGLQDPGYAASQAQTTTKLTDAQRRANSLYTVIEPDAQLLLGDGTAANPGIFDNLGDGGSQAWSGIGAYGVNPLAGLASGDFQAAKDAVTSIAQNYLYAVSGAAAPAEEVKKVADLVTPNPGDSQARKDEKRRRLQTYIQAIQQSTVGGPNSQQQAPGGQTSTGLQWSIEP